VRALTLFILFVYCSLSAQVVGNGDGITTDAQVGIVMEKVPIQGSPYINELYKKGETIINNENSTGALMRYDAYNEAVELLDANGTARKLLRRKNIKAAFDNKIYEVIEYVDGGKNRLSYFNPLNEGITVLYLRPKKIFIQASKPEHGYETYQPPVYKDVSTYYIKKGKEAAIEIELSKRSILNTLKKPKGKLMDYVKDNNLNLKNQEDIIRLLKYYDILLEQPNTKQPYS
jgi:hypothetical protein